MMTTTLTRSHKRKYVAVGLGVAVSCAGIIGGALSYLDGYLGFLAGVAVCLACLALYFSEPSA